jgi:hypothetical protein
VYKLVDAGVEPSDVAEEITDAVMRFSRRCNRLSEPLRLEITREVWEDEDVAEALNAAIERGVGRFEEGKVGRWFCTIGGLDL